MSSGLRLRVLESNFLFIHPMIHGTGILFITMISLVFYESAYPTKSQIVLLHELVNFIAFNLEILAG
jgi:hypothetical protein